VSPSPLPVPDSPSAASTRASWRLAAAVASLVCGILSLLLLGAFVSPFIGVYSAGLLGIWPYPASLACGLIGALLGHLARARQTAPGRRQAAFATAGLVLSYGGILLCVAPYALIYVAQFLGVSSPLMN
jgi:hypothetical protein